jgi:hypothetical protein
MATIAAVICSIPVITTKISYTIIVKAKLKPYASSLASFATQYFER